MREKQTPAAQVRIPLGRSLQRDARQKSRRWTCKDQAAVCVSPRTRLENGQGQSRTCLLLEQGQGHIWQGQGHIWPGLGHTWPGQGPSCPVRRQPVQEQGWAGASPHAPTPWCWVQAAMQLCLPAPGPWPVWAWGIPGCLSQAVSVTLGDDPEQGVRGQGN